MDINTDSVRLNLDAVDLAESMNHHKHKDNIPKLNFNKLPNVKPVPPVLKVEQPKKEEQVFKPEKGDTKGGKDFASPFKKIFGGSKPNS